MAVPAELGDHDARTAAFFGHEGVDVGLQGLPVFVTFDHRVVDAGHGLRVGAVAAEHHFQRVGDLTDGGAQTHGLHGQIQQVAFAGLGALR